jgi:hypothetical protein
MIVKIILKTVLITVLVIVKTLLTVPVLLDFKKIPLTQLVLNVIINVHLVMSHMLIVYNVLKIEPRIHHIVHVLMVILKKKELKIQNVKFVLGNVPLVSIKNINVQLVEVIE